MPEMTASTPLLDPSLVEEIKQVERMTGKQGLFAGFVRKLEEDVAAFGTVFASAVAQGDSTAAARAAHKLKGASRQLGAAALGDLFAEIEHLAKAGNPVEGQGKFEAASELISQSLDALRRA